MAFSGRIVPKVNERNVPFTGSFDLTYRCGLDCRHCYCNLPAGHASRARELTLAEIDRVFGQLADAGCLWLLITGGDPLLREDFWDVYLCAKRKGLIVEFFTNGLLLTPRLLDRLAEYPPYDIEITLYGTGERTHDLVTRVPGSFARTMAAVEAVIGLKLPLTLKTVAMNLNRGELPGLRALAATLGTRFRYDALVWPRIDGSRAPCELRLSPREIVALGLEDERKLAELRREYADGPGGRPESLYLCGAGKFGFNVDPYGTVTPCAMVRKPSFDLRAAGFQDGWSRVMPAFRAQQYSKTGPWCGDCGLLWFCDRCPAWSEKESGDPEAPVEFLCRITQETKEAVTSGGEEHGNEEVAQARDR